MIQEKFDRYKIPEEVDKYQGVVRDCSQEMAEKTSRLRKIEILIKELPKDFKKDLECLYGKLYCQYKGGGESDVFVKNRVVSDEEYIKLIKTQKKKMKILTEKYEEAIKEEIQATSEYYLARDRKGLIESSIKLLIGEFYSVNEEKIK